MIIALELRSKRAARSTPVRHRARLERSALFFYIPFFCVYSRITFLNVGEKINISKKLFQCGSKYGILKKREKERQG